MDRQPAAVALAAVPATEQEMAPEDNSANPEAQAEKLEEPAG